MLVQSFCRQRYYIFFIFLIVLILIYINSNASSFNNQQIKTLLKILAENKSFCSTRSTRRGFNQYVLSVSAYESDDHIELKTNLTWSYIQIFVREAKKFYPSWIVRVYYYNLVKKTKKDMENLEILHDNLDFCHAENLPVLGNVTYKLPGKIQRFLPASKLRIDTKYKH